MLTRKQDVERWIREEGLRLEPFGQAMRITGERVYLIVADLRFVSRRDLAPAVERVRDGDEQHA